MAVKPTDQKTTVIGMQRKHSIHGAHTNGIASAHFLSACRSFISHLHPHLLSSFPSHCDRLLLLGCNPLSSSTPTTTNDPSSRMSSLNKAFGRSLPSDMQQARSDFLISTGQQSLLEKPKQLWKVNDEKAGKNGNCQAVYWVKERPVTNELKRHTSSTSSKPEKQWDNGAVYKGEWKANLKHGYGIQIWSNGNKYEGEWAYGNREGHGVFWLREKPKKKEEEKTSSSTTSSASKKPSSAAAPKLRRVYAGNWKNDLKHGAGVYFYPDGSRYEGSWECDLRCGRGTLYLPTGDSYTGDWKNGSQNGFGTLTKSNKDVYEGEWCNGLREGSGIYYYKTQEKIYDGEWVNDQPKCGVYLDAKEFFDDTFEEQKYQSALGKDPSTMSQAARDGDPSLVSPRVPRNRVSGPPIPRLRMEDADGVLSKAIEGITLERAPMRSLPHVALSEIFDTSSIDALRRIFASYDSNPETGDGSGTLLVKQLPALLQELSLPNMDAPTQARLLNDLRKKSLKERLTFQEFVRAVHLVEEAKQFRKNRMMMEEEEEEY